MRNYFSLNLVGNEFWQSHMENGEKVYRKEVYTKKDEDVLNKAYLLDLKGGAFKEITTGRIMMINGLGMTEATGDTVAKEKLSPKTCIDSPRGITASKGSFSQITASEVRASIAKIRGSKALISEYKKTMEELMLYSELCEIAAERKRKNPYGYARFMELKKQSKLKND